MQPSDSSRNVERASKTVSCSYAFEEGVLQIQIALSKAGGGGCWEGGNTSSVDLLHTMESRGITQIKPEYKQAPSLHKDTPRAPCPSRFLFLLQFLLPPVLSFTCIHRQTLLPIGRVDLTFASIYFFYFFRKPKTVLTGIILCINLKSRPLQKNFKAGQARRCQEKKKVRAE